MDINGLFTHILAENLDRDMFARIAAVEGGSTSLDVEHAGRCYRLLRQDKSKITSIY